MADSISPSLPLVVLCVSMETWCVCVHVCMYVFTSLAKKQKKRSMALVLAEFEVEFFGGQKSL